MGLAATFSCTALLEAAEDDARSRRELNGAVTAVQIRGARLPDQVLVFSGVEAPPKK